MLREGVGVKAREFQRSYDLESFLDVVLKRQPIAVEVIENPVFHRRSRYRNGAGRQPATRHALPFLASNPRSSLNRAFGHDHRVAADRTRLQLALTQFERDLDQARPAHLKTLFDDDLMFAVAILAGC